MAMNLKHVKPVKEDEHSWHFHDTKDDKPFRVAKVGLSPATHKQIAEHFAAGGEALTPAEGAQLRSFFGSPKAEEVAPPVQRDSFGEPVLPGAPTAADPNRPGIFDSAPSPDEQIAQRNARAEAEMKAARPTQEPTPGPSPAQVQPQAPAKPKAAGGGYSGEKDIAQSIKGQQDAAQMMANIATTRSEDEARMKQQAVADEQALTKQYADRGAEIDRRVQQGADDIANSKVDFNRYLANQTTGQKIANTIGIILGGIGGGTNQALGVVNDAINRDVEQQKAELGRKQTVYSNYIQMGHTNREAEQLAIAHLHNLAAAQVDLAATKYAGPQAQQVAQATKAQLQGQGVTLRQNALSEGLTNALKSAQLKQIQGEQETAPLRAQVAQALATGKALDPSWAPYVPPTLRIDTPEGIRVAKDADSRKLIEEAQKSQKQVNDLTSEIDAFRKKNSGGNFFGGAGSTHAKELQKQAFIAAKDLGTKLNLRGDMMEELKDMAPNAADKTTTDAIVKAKTQALRDWAERNMRSAYDVHLQGGKGVSPSFSVTRAGE